MALKGNLTGGLLNANKESDLFKWSSLCASPAQPGLFGYHLAGVEYDLQKPSHQTQAAPISPVLIIHPLRAQIVRTYPLLEMSDILVGGSVFAAQRRLTSV